MADRLTPERRSANMSRIRSKDTGPELAVRRLLHRLGYRFRVHRKDLPGKPDVVFMGRRKIVLVHGCFWHGHATCVDGRRPKSREEYWGPKIAGNIARDARHLAALEGAGWSVMTVWGCETQDEDALAERLQGFLGPKKVNAR